METVVRWLKHPLIHRMPSYYSSNRKYAKNSFSEDYKERSRSMTKKHCATCRQTLPPCANKSCRCSENSHETSCCACHHQKDCSNCHHSHQCCDCCRHQSCRKAICDDDFRLRLGGLQNGLNYRLRQLLGCEVEIQLENDEVVYGEICYVGSNFLELLVEEKRRPKPRDEESEEKCAETAEKAEKHYKEKKNHSLLFPLDKINNLKHNCGCQNACNCGK